jgi:TolB-like protein/Tfp pilus assembly protein PilF
MLRRRKVVQWGIAYLAGAWGFLQGLEYLSETYGWSPLLRMLAVPVLLLGLPVVMVIAWYHGDRGHQRVTRVELAILTMIVALGGGGIWRYYESIEDRASSSTSPWLDQRASAAAFHTDDSRPSVVVLPFENRSADQDDVYFVDGIQDDILTQLTKIRGLRVIASTSADKLRGTSLSAREIGQRLGVSKLLQGRVQRVGDRVRINVLLIDAASESQEWAERYDRTVTGPNILAIQSEVAATVAARLKAGLPAAPDSHDAKASAGRNLEAWEAYQRGHHSDNLQEAEQSFRRAIDADPRFAPAYVGLFRTLVRQIYVSGARRDVNEPEAEAAAETALQLDPTLPDAWLATAYFAQDREGVGAAEARMRKAIELNPNYALAYERLSDLLRDAGRLPEALHFAEKGVALDPLSMGLTESLAICLEASGRLDEAEAQYRRMLAIDPSDPNALRALAEFEAYVRDRLALAVTLQEKAVSLAPDNAYLVGTLALLYMDLEDDSRAAALLDDATQRWPDRTNINLAAAFLAMFRGDQLGAMRYAGKVLETSPSHMGGIVILTQADFARNDFAAARARFALASPEFLAPVPPEIHRQNVGQAILAASILLATNDGGRARVLLDRSERVIRTMPRLGQSTGYGIVDVFIHALRGDKGAALGALRAAIKDGWRGPMWRAQLLFDRDLALLHGDPVFEASVAEIRRDMARQRAELAAMTKDAAAVH